MKVKATKKGYYGNKIRKIGEIFDCLEKQIPSWTTLVDGIETQESAPEQSAGTGGVTNTAQEARLVRGASEKKQQVVKIQKEKTEKNTPQAASNDDKKTENNGIETQENTNTVNLSDAQKQEYLEQLISEGIEKNILIENADKKTVDEQITELETALKKKEV